MGEGEEKEPFVVHENLLTFYSEFFRAALTGRFKEASGKTVEIEEDVQLFEFFCHWIYYQRWPCREEGDDPAFVTKWEGADLNEGLSINHLIKLYVLADRYGVPQLRKDAIDKLFDFVHIGDGALPDRHMVRHAFEWLLPKSPMCRFLVDLLCHHEDEDSYDPDLDENQQEASAWPESFLLQTVYRSRMIMYRLRRDGDELEYFSLNICNYHEHKSNEEKAACEAERDRKQKAEEIRRAYWV